MNSVKSNLPKVIFHCQYVYGIGHLVRTLEMARGLSQDFQVFVLSGGEAVPSIGLPDGINFIQLPAIYKEEDSDSLRPIDHSMDIDKCFELREEIINGTMQLFKPDLLITEHFPFGLLFEKEVVGLITKSRKINPNIKIVSSVRDFIESNEGGARDLYVCSLINKYYDLVMVHGDEKFVSLADSFPSIGKINIPVVHTGYIVGSIPSYRETEAKPVILASVAAGRLGSELLDAIIESHLAVKVAYDHKMVLFAGAFQKDYETLMDKVGSLKSNDIIIRIFNRDIFLNYLSTAKLVISLGGYNSIIEAIAAKKPMLIYQREFMAGNKEQSLRINMLKKKGYLDVINFTDLSNGRLPDLIFKKINQKANPNYILDINGVVASCKLLSNLINNN